MWQTVELKQKFISQVMSSKAPARSCEDVDETSLSFAEVKALAAGDPHIKERMTLDTDVKRLKMLKAGHLNQKYELEYAISKGYPERIKGMEAAIIAYKADIELLTRTRPQDPAAFAGMTIRGMFYEEKGAAGAALLEACKTLQSSEPLEIGAYRGFTMALSFNTMDKSFLLALRGNEAYAVVLGSDVHGNITRIDNKLSSLEKNFGNAQAELSKLNKQLEEARIELERPFEQEFELRQKSERLAELDGMLKFGGRCESNAALLTEQDELEHEPELEREARVR
jgi:hypothetical protein